MLRRRDAWIVPQLGIGQYRCTVLPTGLVQIVCRAGEDVAPVAPQIAMSMAVADRKLAIARWHELQRAHRAGVGAADAQWIEAFLVREQQKLCEFALKEG